MPLQSQRKVDKLLSNISVRYKNDELIGRQVFPQVNVIKDSDLFRVYERQVRLPETKRKSGALAREMIWNVSTSSYLLEQNALVDYIADEDKDNYDPGDLRADTVEQLTDTILLRLENDAASLFTSTVWSQNVSLAAADQFSLDTTTAANPLQIMDTMSSEVLLGSGHMPNYAIVPRSTFVALKNNSTYIWERVKYTSREMTEAILQGLIDVGPILYPKAALDSAADGVTSNISFMWGDNMFIGYKPASAGIKKPSAGYLFMKNKPFVRTWRDEAREADAIEVQMKYDIKAVATLAGALIIDTNA